MKKTFIIFLASLHFFSCSASIQQPPAWVALLRAMDIKAVIFDMDNTIINTSKVQENAFFKTIESCLGRKVTAEEQATFLPWMFFDGINLALKLNKHFEAPIFPITIRNEIDSCFFKDLEKEIKFIEGFEYFSTQLKLHGFKLAIGTNASSAFLSIINKILKLSDYFDSHLYSYEFVECKLKPAPDLFLHIAQKLGVAPHQCLVFGDTRDDLIAANASLMQFVCIEHSYNHGLRCYTQAAISNYNFVYNGIAAIRQGQPTVDSLISLFK